MPYLPEKAGMIYYAITSFTVRFEEETAVNILSYRLRTIYTRHLSSCLFVGCTHSPPVTSLPMLPGIRSLAVAMHLEIHRV